MSVKALVASGANALALLPPHAQRGLVLVVGVGAGQSAEGTVSSQEPGKAISLQSVVTQSFPLNQIQNIIKSEAEDL